MTLLKSKSFWILSFVFISILLIVVLYIFPPLGRQFATNRAEIKRLNQAAEANEQYLATIDQLAKRQTELDQLYQAAGLALPIGGASDRLLLELDGLTRDLGLAEAAINVPYSSSSTAADTGEGEETAQASAEIFTITGPFNFAQLNQLLVRLQTFSRWNQVSAFRLTDSGGSFSATITSQIGRRPITSRDFSGSAKLIDQAKEVFGQLRTYSTLPDPSSEGTFGKTDPFAN